MAESFRPCARPRFFVVEFVCYLIVALWKFRCFSVFVSGRSFCFKNKFGDLGVLFVEGYCFVDECLYI